MARNFASLALARLYEKQGYIDEALEIYKEIDTSQDSDAKSILDTICRLEKQTKTAQPKTAQPDRKDNLSEPGYDALTLGQTDTKEERMSHMLESWLKLIVTQKRVNLFKSIKSRL